MGKIYTPVFSILLIARVTEFYKDLFRMDDGSSLRIDGIECDHLSDTDKRMLTRSFVLEEVKEVVF